MTAEELCEHIQALPPGGVEVLSRIHFEETFAQEVSLEAKKGAAAALAQRCGCDAVFLGTEEIFVRFQRNGAIIPASRGEQFSH